MGSTGTRQGRKPQKTTLLQKNRIKKRLEDHSTPFAQSGNSCTCIVVFQSFFTTIFLQQSSLPVFSSLPCFCTFNRLSPTCIYFLQNFLSVVHLCNWYNENCHAKMQISHLVFLFHHVSAVGQSSGVFIPALFLYFYRTIKLIFTETFIPQYLLFLRGGHKAHITEQSMSSNHTASPKL